MVPGQQSQPNISISTVALALLLNQPGNNDGYHTSWRGNWHERELVISELDMYLAECLVLVLWLEECSLVLSESFLPEVIRYLSVDSLAA